MNVTSLPSIGCVGAGNMGLSIIEGLLNAGVNPNTLMLSNHSTEKLNHAQARLNIRTTTDNVLVTHSQQIIILAVKPQHLVALLKTLAPTLPTPSPLFISIAAGIQTKILSHYLPNSPIIRAMPNTAMQIQCSATSLYATNTIKENYKLWSEAIFNKLGTTTWVGAEHLLDITTAIAGSGPAYFYLFMDYFIQIATKKGLNKEQAHQLVSQTALGAATLAQQHPNTPLHTLKQNVTSKGGTTAAALNVLESSPLNNYFEQAIEAAINRAKELNVSLS